MVAKDGNVVDARIGWVDAAKGWGIFLVVIGHIIVGLRDSGVAPLDGMMVHLHYLIYTFHMPLFFLLSGLFLVKRLRFSGGVNFAKESSLRLGRSYILWGLVQVVAFHSAAGLTNGRGDGLSFYSIVSLLWQPPANFWYIYALIVLNIYGAVVMPRIGLAFFVVCGLFVYSLSTVFVLPAAIWGACNFVLFFSLGALLGADDFVFKKPSFSLKMVLLLVFGFLWYFLAEYLFLNKARQWSVATFATGLVGSAFVVIWSQIRISFVHDLISYLGRQSLSIYLLHVLFAAGTRIIMMKLFGVNSLTVLFVSCVIVGISGPLLFKLVADKLKISSRIGLI